MYAPALTPPSVVPLAPPIAPPPAPEPGFAQLLPEDAPAPEKAAKPKIREFAATHTLYSALVHDCDTDGDGLISLAEMQAVGLPAGQAGPYPPAQAGERAQLLAGFGAFDRNQDGRLSHSEVARSSGDRLDRPEWLGAEASLIWSLRRAVMACEDLLFE